ncbi:K+-transporting ATPase [cyanobacterium TDX16]|nr:K+-transporting ATPase [cyanobacterium TDX16]
MKRQTKLNQLPITNYQLPITNLSFTRHKLPLVIFLVLSLNVILAPIVYAATDGTWQRTQAYALGILGFITLALVIYLFDVVFRPERY